MKKIMILKSTKIYDHCLIKKSTNLTFFPFLKTVHCIDKRSCVSTVFIDESKAFDCVHQDVLLNKIERYGICGKALHWLTSYSIAIQQCTNVTFIL